MKMRCSVCEHLFLGLTAKAGDECPYGRCSGVLLDEPDETDTTRTLLAQPDVVHGCD